MKYSWHITQTTLLLSSSVISGCVPVIVAGAMGGSTVIATSAAEERGLTGVVSDKELSIKVNNHIESINRDLMDKITIMVRGKRVLLMGTVPNQKMQIDAVRGAWEIKGVMDVIDEIHVGLEISHNQIIKDGWISTQLKTKLVFSDNIMSINYDYHTHNGTVYIMGMAQNQSEQDSVITIARRINGVKHVVSHIILKAPTP